MVSQLAIITMPKSLKRVKFPIKEKIMTEQSTAKDLMLGWTPENEATLTNLQRVVPKDFELLILVDLLGTHFADTQLVCFLTH